MTVPVKGLLTAAFLALALLAAAARPAAAAAPCWKTLLNDWYDGRIDHTYPIACYDQALKHLPTDVQEYSSAHDDIERALLSAKAHDRRSGRPSGPATLVVPPRRPTTTRRSPTTSPTSTLESSSEVSATTPLPATTSLPGNRPHGGIARLADQLNPASPSSLPVPLLVLGGLAILLVAAGAAGVLVRRSQNRS